ncbi:MAG: 4-(cytidine 5'-diphospho)-2-C-methyl-D-erythritol kinase [Acidimicrobiales bacterium]|nr:4-(cytidine 5'-diphospho)-2-C-methyl-D-erythritol kinase [Acidimicrobiales bacterium]
MPDPTATVTVTAPAKLTLSLRITGVRDDGYHLIDAVMVALDLADELAIGAGDGLEVVGATGLAVPADDDNLVRRALRAVGRTASVRLTKRIPAGAGLGGGSADAAAVLRWAGVHDPAVAVSLGADVPFCVRGGRARVRGVGEEVEPLPFVAETYTVATPPVGCATPAVYRAWDELGGPTAEGPNDLEPAALVVAPELARWRDRLGDATGEVPVLAGSGSTWFVPGAFPEAGTVVRTVPAHPSAR